MDLQLVLLMAVAYYLDNFVDPLAHGMDSAAVVFKGIILSTIYVYNAQLELFMMVVHVLYILDRF